MSLSASRPKPAEIDFEKLDAIQAEVFGNGESENQAAPQKEGTKPSDDSPPGKTSAAPSSKKKAEKPNLTKKTSSKIERTETDISGSAFVGEGNIAEMLKGLKPDANRLTTRPFTVPKRLMIDLSRLKAKFRNGNHHKTQNELLEQLLKESIGQISADNYGQARANAASILTSLEECTRRSLTLTERSILAITNLKADLEAKLKRRFSSDEILTTLLAAAIASLYEKELLP